VGTPIDEAQQQEEAAAMWNWFNCYLSGRHEFGVWCEPGAIFLRCVHCGRRSSGWAVSERDAQPAAASAKSAGTARPANAARIVPFSRAAAR
jgi:hypothetical protein